MRITADEIAAGLYDWFGANPWFLKVSIDAADLAQEAAAQQALLLLASDDRDAFVALPLGVQGLAARFLLSYMAELLGPLRHTSGELSPDLAAATPAQRAWHVIAAEIERRFPPPPRPH